MVFMQAPPTTQTCQPNLSDNHHHHQHHRDSPTGRSAGRPDIPTCPTAIDAHSPVASASTSSTSTSTSTSQDQTFTDSTDWNGEATLVASQPLELAVPVKVRRRSHVLLPMTPSTLPDTDYRARSLTAESMMDDISPKVEELDDDDLQCIKAAEVEDERDSPTGAPVAVPRKRGRPRKHPPPITSGTAKTAKGRSKTGCITCRRRKKKCDETQPECLNCKKNAVICEGYPTREIWKSGRQRQVDATQIHALASVPRSLPRLIDGIETELDRRFLDHFVYGFSRVLTLINDDSNPFKQILLPMAFQHQGLMHSLMCLSGSHLSVLDPEPKLKERKYFHFHRAIRDLKDNINAWSSKGEKKPQQLLVEDPIIASTIALSLNTICEGQTHGEYRPHMDAARYLLVLQQSRDEKFRKFIVEFFQYHDVSNSLTSLDRRPALLQGNLQLPEFVPGAQAGMFLGVFDGLFNYISEITKLRDRIRLRLKEGHESAVDYQILSQAVSLDTAIRTWETSHEPDTPNWSLAQLYRQSTWLYLFRTIQPSRSSDKITQAVDDGLAYLDKLPQDAGAYSIVLMPLFLLGCSAFLPQQRERIQKGFDTLRAYSNLRNIEHASRVVIRVWEIMDTKIEESWDWEKIIRDMDMDFLIT